MRGSDTEVQCVLPNCKAGRGSLTKTKGCFLPNILYAGEFGTSSSRRKRGGDFRFVMQHTRGNNMATGSFTSRQEGKPRCSLTPEVIWGQGYTALHTRLLVGHPAEVYTQQVTQEEKVRSDVRCLTLLDQQNPETTPFSLLDHCTIPQASVRLMIRPPGSTYSLSASVRASLPGFQCGLLPFPL